MNATYMKTVRFLMMALLLGVIAPVWAAKGAGFITVTGVVKDRESRKVLENANISVLGTSVSTVTNEDGVFSIKVGDSIQVRTIEVSFLGYRSQRVALQNQDMADVTVFLTPNATTLPEVLIRGINALDLVKRASAKIALNNSPANNMLTGFYRETIRKRRNYINVTEAIVNVYKTPYSEDVDRDRVQVYKGRQLLSPKTSDTLVVKLQGGPNYSIYMDVVKNRDVFFSEESIHDYRFYMETSTMLDERPHYVVGFEPQVDQPYPLFYGKMYIDEATLTFTQVEFNFSMKDRSKVVAAILRKKPFNLRFKPEEISYLVTYKTENGVSYLNYMRNSIRFKCDWKRKLFSTTYTVVTEMVVTDKRLNPLTGIPYRQVFRDTSVLSDKVNNFYDENFWEGYNIIAPSESLETAVTKLKKANGK